MKKKLDEYLESDANPCGKYNNAKECVCKDGTTKYTPSIEYDIVRGNPISILLP